MAIPLAERAAAYRVAQHHFQLELLAPATPEERGCAVVHGRIITCFRSNAGLQVGDSVSVQVAALVREGGDLPYGGADTLAR